MEDIKLMALNVKSTEELQGKAEELKDNALIFKKRASEVEKEAKRQSRRWLTKKLVFWGGTIIVLIIIAVVVIVLWKF